MKFPSFTNTWHKDVYAEIDAARYELSAEGKRVVITGGGGGIGAATAEAFVVAGAAEVIILDRTEKTLLATKNTIRDKHNYSKVITVVADISDQESTANAFDMMAKRGLIDIYINNAGYLSDLSSLEISNNIEWWKSFEVNVRGSLFAIQSVLKNISKNGVMINVTTGAAHVPYVPGYSAYAVSKLGSAKLFEYLQAENPDLRIFNLQPGVIESTAISTKATEQSGFSFPDQDTVQLPSNFMVWLSSPEAAFLKGRFVWANWDVTELKQKESAFQADPTLLTLGLLGWIQ
ncbi:hypothetical protein AYL99_03953 [Fonsecaea erecta]|uniref:Uncharacterized protein n=1 Tax=Fonsecaea erecta TaxID=1367422 RepID=A0A178ZPL5_9EURO|nr:hypothetical protein AYL99_03953 [Fonsecaea erecta]OAP61750.1 hypothetical protein AYL99_03953 [Fonsecaea erecta]